MTTTTDEARIYFRMRSYQRRPLQAMNDGCRRFVEVLHRRAGKDRNWLNITLQQMLKRKGVYFHVFPSLNQGRRDIWDNLIQERGVDGIERSFPMLDMFPRELIAPNGKNETEMQIRLVNGSVWQIMGADSQEAIDRLRGPNPVGVVFSEYAHMLPGAWDVISPVLAENKGWAAFIYTPNGENHGYERYKHAKDNSEWFCQLLTIEDTRRDALGEDGSPVITKEEVDRLRREGQREEFLQQEYYCSFTGYRHGTIYGDLMNQARAEKRVGRIPYVTNLPVGTCWDLGHSDATAIWFYQRIDQQIRFIDYLEDRLKSVHHYARALRENYPYVYGRLVLPHDARYKGLAAEQSVEEYLYSVGFKSVVVAPRTPNIQNDIDAVRRQFSRFYFDEVKCARGIDALDRYARKWDDTKRVFASAPMHDEWSHGADALRTGVMGGFDPLLFMDTAVDVKVETDFDPRRVP